MKGYNRWNYHPYQPLDEPEALERPYICRLEPGERELLVEWFDPTGAGDVRLCYTLRDSGVWKSCPAEKRLCRLEGLEPGRDYELYLENGRGVRSNCRLARTGAVPGKVINYLHPEDHQYAFSGQYLCSPSIVKLPDGTLIASMDYHRGDRPQNLTSLSVPETEERAGNILPISSPASGARFSGIGIGCTCWVSPMSMAIFS